MLLFFFYFFLRTDVCMCIHNSVFCLVGDIYDCTHTDSEKEQAQILKSYPAKLKLTSLQCLTSSIQSFGVAIAFERDIQKWKLGWDMKLLAVVYCVSIKVIHSIPATSFL